MLLNEHAISTNEVSIWWETPVGKIELLILKKESTITRVLAAQGVGPASQPPIKITLVNE